MKSIRLLLLLASGVTTGAFAQSGGLTDMSQSRFAKMANTELGAVHWTDGFWGDRFNVYSHTSLQSMWDTWNNPDVSHGFRNFEIAAGVCEGEHWGPPFHDGDMYKWMEGVASVYAVTKDPELDKLMDHFIEHVVKAQRADGYIHTPVIIEEKNKGIDTHSDKQQQTVIGTKVGGEDEKGAFANRLNFETYNLGHLMMAGIIHRRATGKTTLFDAAVKATDFLCHFYETASAELARNAICPSHYMGVVEMYRATGNPRYLELSKNLIDIRGMVENGTDDNQDRIKSVEIQGDSAAVRFHHPESRIQFEHPWPRPMVTKDGHNSAFYLTNAMELLDEPGEWYHDIESRKIYYYPRKGEKISKAVVPGIETLVWVEGTIDRPVKHIRFDNIAFQYTTWMRPSLQGHVPLQAGMYMTDGYKIRPSMIRKNNHKLDNQGWLGRPASAVVVKAAWDIDFEKCRFQHLGSTGIDYEWATDGGHINGCLFRDIAGNGIVAGSFSPAAHETHLPYDPADRREVCTGLTISNNYINDVTNEDWGTLGICAGYVSDINIEHNEISDVSYSGISLGWGWTRTVNCMRNNRVHANLIHHYAKHMYDVAGIYTLGSQPHSWITENCVSNIFSPGYAHDPNHWFYLYTDEGSSFITVKDNWTEGEKFLKNANGPGNTWENNGPMVNDSIKANAGLPKEYSYLKEK